MPAGVLKPTSHEFLEVVRGCLCQSTEVNAKKVLRSKKLLEELLNAILSGEVELCQSQMEVYHPSGMLKLEIKIPSTAANT